MQEANLEAQQYQAQPLVQRLLLLQVSNTGHLLHSEHAICSEVLFLMKLRCLC